MSIHRFNSQVRYTLGIESKGQQVAFQQLITEFLRALHRIFVRCGRNHSEVLAVLRDSMGSVAAGYLAAVLSVDKLDQDARQCAPWPGDEQINVDHKRLVDAMTAAITDLCFSQDVFPLQNCAHAIELFLRDLMEACTSAEEAPYLAYFVIGDEAAFHLTGLMPEAQRDALLDDLDIFPERLERFHGHVRGWEYQSKKESDWF